MAKFIVNNYNSKNPVLQADTMTTTFGKGYQESVVNSGHLTNGSVIYPFSGTIKQWDDGRIEINGKPINWEEIVRASTKPQIVNIMNGTGVNVVGNGASLIQVFGEKKEKKVNELKLPEEMPNEPDAREGEKVCVICNERSIKTTIVDCGHQVHCITCSRTTMKSDSSCPICRHTPITQIIRHFEV